MPVFEPIAGLRVIADPAALDGARWSPGPGTGPRPRPSPGYGQGSGVPVTVLRFAPDDAFAIGAVTVDLEDEHAIVELEAGFVAARLPLDVVARHVDWALPTERPAFAQGSVAAVPAKLWIEARGGGPGGPDRWEGQHGPDDRHDEEVLLLTPAAYAHDLAERLR